jgi:hypothetical protein
VAIIAHLAYRKPDGGFYETSIRCLENFEAATSRVARSHAAPEGFGRVLS